MATNTEIVKLESIRKEFPGVVALDGVSFSLKKGEIHALVGENGAGKSTLIKILAGIYTPTSGKITVKGKTYTHLTPSIARDLGIAVVHQELSVIDTQTVAEALFMGEITQGAGFISWKKMNTISKNFLSSLGLDLPVQQSVGSLTIAQKQLLEIARAVFQNADIVVMDEPTSSLSEAEVEFLFNVIKNLKSKGVSIIYISHRLSEVKEIADEVTVLRDGKVTGNLKRDEIDIDRIVSYMVGRKLSFKYGSHQEFRQKKMENRRIGSEILKVEHLKSGKKVKDVTFELREGEILGLFGVVGSGRTETLKAVIGAGKKDGGTIILHGQPIRLRSPYYSVKKDIGFVPEDRRYEGLIFTFNLSQNISLPTFVKRAILGMFGWVEKKLEKMLASSAIEKLRIKTPGIDSRVDALSGGNQQKVVIGKWLFSNSKILILDEPTRGIDVGAKEEIYNLILELASSGISVIFSSSELPEILMLCDRVVVFNAGRTVATFDVDSVTETEILRAATT